MYSKSQVVREREMASSMYSSSIIYSEWVNRVKERALIIYLFNRRGFPYKKDLCRLKSASIGRYLTCTLPRDALSTTSPPIRQFLTRCWVPLGERYSPHGESGPKCLRDIEISLIGALFYISRVSLGCRCCVVRFKMFINIDTWESRRWHNIQGEIHIKIAKPGLGV